MRRSSDAAAFRPPPFHIDPTAALKELGPPADTDRLAEAGRRAALGREDLARRGHAPDGARRLRRFSLHETAQRVLGLAPGALRDLIACNPALPRGAGPGRAFSFAETQTLRAALSPAPFRPEGLAAKVVAAANFKGGVGKTSLAAHLAMAAALDGARVLAVDLDSQGSLTSIFGARPEDAWGTAYPLLARDFARALQAAGRAVEDEALAAALALDPRKIPRKTHWPAVDLIPAQLELYWAEFQVPVWRLSLPSWRLWEAFDTALTEMGARETYDLIVIDTPPALGYLTVNALAAADIVFAPLGASFLEFDSTGRFFDMLHATFASIEEGESAASRALGLGEVRFEWDAVRAVLTRYDAAQQKEMADHIAASFGDLMARHRIEATALIGQAGEQVKGILEADPRDFNPATLRRGRETFDLFYAEAKALLVGAWERDRRAPAGEPPAGAPPAGEAPAGAPPAGEPVSHAKHAPSQGTDDRGEAA